MGIDEAKYAPARIPGIAAGYQQSLCIALNHYRAPPERDNEAGIVVALRQADKYTLYRTTARKLLGA